MTPRAKQPERSPALAPAPPAPPTEARYEVTGTQPVHGHAPGTKFTMLMDPAQEEVLLAYGHLRKVK